MKDNQTYGEWMLSNPKIPMTDKQPQTCYVPTDEKLDSSKRCDVTMYANVYEATCVKLENVYIHTPEELEELKTKWEQDRWISVKDEMPLSVWKKYDSVAVIADVKDSNPRQLRYKCDEVRGKQLFRWHDSYGLFHMEVLNWQLLPAPPQK